MTDNRTTEKLCNLLEERGVNCQTNYLHVSWRVGPKLYDAIDNFNGTLTVDNLTPEQAIAATLDSGTCRNDWAEFGKFKCSECGLQVDSISTGTTTPIPIAFCPRCGRKVEQ